MSIKPALTYRPARSYTKAAAAPLRAGVPETLKRLKRAGVRLTVLSASEHGMLCRQLRQRGVYGLFDEVLGLGDFRAQDKLGIAREWCARTRPARALMIGDTDHDAAVAAAIGAVCVLYTGGHQSRARLEKVSPYVIDDLAQLPALLETI